MVNPFLKPLSHPMVRPLARRAAAVAVRTEPGREFVDRRVLELRIRSLLESDLVDREYYEAQAQRPFADDEAVVADYFRVGASRGWSLTPLFSAQWYATTTAEAAYERAMRSAAGPSIDDAVPPLAPASARARRPRAPRPWYTPRTGIADAFLSMYFGLEPIAETSPWFDAEAYARSLEALGRPRPRSSREALVTFVRESTDATPLPLSSRTVQQSAGGELTWGDARRAAIAHADRMHWVARRSRSPQTEEWDHDRELLLLEELAAVEVPDPPLVSIIMPARDRGRAISWAIESVIAQTWTSWELIIVDDGSADDTADIAQTYADADPRVRVVSQPPTGVSAARNLGIASSTGSIVAFLDSDNQWREHVLSSAVAGFEREGVDALYFAFRLLHSNGHVTYLGFEGDLDYLLYSGNFVDLNTLLVRREILDEVGVFDEEIRRWVDMDLSIRIFQRTRPAFLPFVGVDYNHRDDVSRITSRESSGWQTVVLSKYLMDWTTVEQTLDERDAGLVSVIIPTYEDWRMTIDAVHAVLERSGPHRVELVVVDNGSAHTSQEVLHRLLVGDDRVTLVSLQRNTNFALGSNLGFATSRGGTVVFLNNDTTVHDGWLSPLLRELEDPDVLGVQPLVLNPDGRVQSAGIAFADDRVTPWRFLAGFAESDAHAAGQTRVAAISGVAMAMRAADVARVHGFDPIFANSLEDVDLCLRLAGGECRFAVALDARVTHAMRSRTGHSSAEDDNRRTHLRRWRRRLPDTATGHYRALGVEISRYDLGQHFRAAVHRDTVPVVRRIPSTVDAGPWRGRERLRWAIKIAAPGDSRGARWGDTWFAADLASALRRQGQEVVVDHRESHTSPAETLDDVVLVLRGLDLVPPNPDATNLLWIISHPDLVSDAELASFDAVFAAAAPWAAATTSRTGIAVRPLLQATSPDRFFPRARAIEHDVAFVGASRNIHRAMVRHAHEQGIALSIFGPGWEQFLGDDAVVEQWVAPESLGDLYRGIGLLLNDHWDDMARLGFVSNRLFDAVASGTPVVTDHVPGVEEIFGGMIRVVRDGDELRDAVVSRADWVPDAATRHAAAERVLREHSFDARASTLIETAYRLRGA